MNGLAIDGLLPFQKKKGELSKKEKEINLKKDLLEKSKESLIYKKVLETFSDAELIYVEKEKENND